MDEPADALPATWHHVRPVVERSVRKRVGDVVLAAREPVVFLDPTFTVEQGLAAGHGSLTASEMLVPVLAARGRA